MTIHFSMFAPHEKLDYDRKFLSNTVYYAVRGNTKGKELSSQPKKPFELQLQFK